ncbi:MAG: PAS domain-containing protein, partial [Sutterellaceae bacterium]|nr:PAS domain-containing protein [Burkholderiaceae bacterium]MDW8429091.1 PAS domain-containing protein [Sutterellaceae bacterium]
MPKTPQQRADTGDEALSHVLTRLSGIGAWIFDLASGQMSWSEQTRCLLQIDDPAVAPSPPRLFAAFEPAARAALESAWHNAIALGQPWDLELPLAAIGGGTRWLRSVGAPEQDGGRCVRLTGIFQDISAARQAREALRARTDETRRLALVAEHTSDLVIVTDGEHRIEWVNRSFERVTGYTLAEVAGRTPRAVLNREETEQSPHFRALRQRTLAGLDASGVELKLFRKDGTPYWVELEQRPVRDDTGAIRHYIHVQRDITARRLAQSQQRDLARRLQLIAAFTDVGIFQREVDHDSGFWDGAMFRLFGFTPAPQPPPIEAVLTRVHPADRDRYRRYLESLRQQPESSDIEFRVIHDDGDIRWLYERGRLEITSDGHRQAVGVVLDVTAQRSAEREAVANAERLRLAIEATGIGFFYCDADSARLELDPQARALFGLDPQVLTLPRWQFEALVVAEDRLALARLLPERVLTEGAVDAEFRIVRGGEHRWLRVRCAPAPGDAGGERRIIGMVVDITAQKRLEAQREVERNRLALATSGLAVGIWERELDRDRAYWSAEAFALWGLPPREQAPTWAELLALVHPEDRERFERRWEVLANSPAFVDTEFRVLRPDGTVAWLMTRGRLDAGSAQRPARVIGIVFDITARKQAEEQAREMAGWLRLATASVGIGLWYRNLDEPRPHWDEQTYRIFGLDPGSGPPSVEQWLAMVLPEDRARIAALDYDRVPAGTTLSFEYRIRRPDGEVRHLQSRRACLYDASGRPLRVYGAVIDVTDHTLARSERDALLKRMQIIVESVGVGIWDWDPVARTSTWNDRMYEMFGRPRQWFAERTWLDAVHPEDRTTARQRMAEALARGDRFDIEFRVLRPDDSVRWIAARGRVLRDDQGRAVRMIGVNVDLTAHRRTELQARELLERMQLATQAAGVGIWELELPALRMHWDEQTFRLVGRTPQDFADLSAQWTCVIHPDDMPAMRAAQRRALKELQPIDLEVRVVRPSGEVRHVVLRGQIQRDALGRPAKQFGVVIDVTERKQAEDALRAKEAAERANQAKTEFLSRISHELRTPLNAILGFTQILEIDREQPLSPVQRERVQHIQQAGWHLLALIDEILDFSRIETGKARLTFAAVPLAEVVDECLPLVAPDAHRRGITIEVTGHAEAPAAWADRTRIKQVLLNLLSNAIK